MNNLCRMGTWPILTTIFLVGCVTGNGYQASQESLDYCNYGSCSKTPAVLLIKSTDGSVSPTKRRAWMYYDGKFTRWGPKFMSVLDEGGQTICEGAYTWSGWGLQSSGLLKCGSMKEPATGSFVPHERQTVGRYAGKGTGTGRIKLKNSIIFAVFGITEDEAADSKLNFRDLWLKYGGALTDL